MKEKLLLKPNKLFYYERKLKKLGAEIIIGIDEAGRGPLAGPVVAAAVALKKNNFQNRIDDSKKLNPSQREKAYSEIIAHSDFGISIVSEQVIDRVNIRNATRLAMEEAVAKLVEKIKPRGLGKVHLMVDGDMEIRAGFPCLAIVKGDGKSKSIAAASILAKVTRDRIMDIYDKAFPQYGFLQHKGYPTAMHRNRIRQFGLSVIHRASFNCD